MKRNIVLILMAMMALSLGACSTKTKEKLGLVKKAPNEYMVEPRAPLSLPPEYNLRPVAEPKAEEPKTEKLEGISEAEQEIIENVE